MNNTSTGITEEDNTTITCEAVGYPPPTIVWSKTNGTLSDRVSVSDSVSVATGNGNVTSVTVNLTLTNANREDTGLYQCTASNGVDSGTRNVTVTIECKFTHILVVFKHVIKVCAKVLHRVQFKISRLMVVCRVAKKVGTAYITGRTTTLLKNTQY